MEEVKALDEKNGGGNRLARELWMADMPESEHPGPDSSLEAIKRFVERVYIDERWKSKGGKPKDREARRDKAVARDAANSLAEDHAASESASTSRTSTPKHRHRKSKRRQAPSEVGVDSHGWDMAEFGGYTGNSFAAANVGAYNGSEYAIAAVDAWQMPGNFGMRDMQATPSVSEAAYEYTAAEAYVQQQMPHLHNGWSMGIAQSAASLDKYQPPHTPQARNMVAANGMPSMSEVPMQSMPSSTSARGFENQSWGHLAQNVGPAAQSNTHQHFLLYNAGLGSDPYQRSIYSSTPVTSPPLRPASTTQVSNTAHAQKLASKPSAIQPPMSSQVSLPRSTRRTPTVLGPVTLHPTNPWAEDLGSKIITIEPTNPWADVVTGGFIRAATPAC
jgi:hypothetical protein